MPTPIMPTLVWQQLSDSERLAALARPAQSPENNIAAIVADIGKQVQADSDKALYQFAKQFDQVDLDNLTVEQSVLQAAVDSLDDKLKNAIKQAFTNIHNFHLAQQSPPVDVAIQAGIRCQVLTRPIERVGLYIPGGSAPLFSTVLMLAIPAKIAACKHIVLCSPAPIHPAILYTAHLCGVDKVYAVGGAGAIFAMAYGTDSIPKVDKIFGPGNAFVTEAKRQVMMTGTAIDMPAGPSEVLVIADEFANADFVASDLLSQAEHGADSQVVLITPSKAFADKVDKALKQQLERLPRANTARLALAHSCVLIASDIDEAVHISNLYAPEHLIIQTQKPRQLLDAIYHAGSVFLGAYSPESMGDYASGTNHVLPTYGYARTHSSLGLADFSKRMTVQELSEQGFVSLAETVAVMAEAEELIAHKQAVSIRLQQLGV